MSADPARPQLGELLVHKGVLTEIQLELALAEQRRSGAPLVEILVRLGILKGPTIANALADQHGGPLRTEYGLSIGPTRAIGTPLEAVPDKAAETEHLVFFAGTKGYKIIARSGPPPEVGTVVEVAVDGGVPRSLTVMKVGPSPLPGTRTRYAYLA